MPPSRTGSPHEIDVDSTVDALDVALAGELPHEPVAFRTQEDPPFPEWSVESVEHRVLAAEVVEYVEHDFGPGLGLDLLDERLQFGQHLFRRRPSAAVSRQLQIDSHRELSRLVRNDLEEVPGLFEARTAQGEEVVRASIESRVACAPPVLVEASIDEVPTFGGLDVDELDVIVGDSLPVDLALVIRDIEAVSLTLAERRPVMRESGPASNRKDPDNHHDEAGERPRPPAPTAARFLIHVFTGNRHLEDGPTPTAQPRRYWLGFRAYRVWAMTTDAEPADEAAIAAAE